MINIKPIVYFFPTKMDFIQVGKSALILPLNHPSEYVSNNQFARTSLVIGMTEDGFETQNTVYKRAKISEEGSPIF